MSFLISNFLYLSFYNNFAKKSNLPGFHYLLAFCTDVFFVKSLDKLFSLFFYRIHSKFGEKMAHVVRLYILPLFSLSQVTRPNDQFFWLSYCRHLSIWERPTLIGPAQPRFIFYSLHRPDYLIPRRQGLRMLGLLTRRLIHAICTGSVAQIVSTLSCSSQQTRCGCSTGSSSLTFRRSWPTW